MIKFADLERLIVERDGLSIQRFYKDNNIDEMDFYKIINKVVEALEVDGHLRGILITMFELGWEAHKQYATN